MVGNQHFSRAIIDDSARRIKWYFLLCKCCGLLFPSGINHLQKKQSDNVDDCSYANDQNDCNLSPVELVHTCAPLEL